MNRYYVKVIDEFVHLYHRPSHFYISYFDSFEDCANFLYGLEELDEKELWKKLLFDYQVRMPHREVIKGMRKHSGWTESEELYRKAWSKGTDRFYEEYPDLLVEEDIPFDLIQEIHIEVTRERVRHEKHMESERVKAEKAYAKAMRKVMLIGDQFVIRRVAQ